MKRSVRLGTLVAVLSLAMGMVAVPASARPLIDTAVIVFGGSATVCAQDNNPAVNGTAPGCPLTTQKKNGTNNTSGSNGLYLIGQPDKAGNRPNHKWTQRTGLYAFSSTAPLGCRALSLDPANPDRVKDCTIAASGKLAPVAGIGAACGMSHGHSGRGSFTATNPGGGVVTYELTNVGWPFSVGGTLPVTGTYRYVSSTPSTKKDKGALNSKRLGPIVGVVQAQGGAQCVKLPTQPQHGASNFTVVGVVAAL